MFRRLFGSFIAFLFLALLVSAGFQLTLYRQLVLRETRTSASAMLAQAERYTSQLLEQILTTGQQLVAHRDIAAAILSRDLDRILEYRAYLAARFLMAANPSIDHVGVFNARTRRYLMIGGSRYSDPTMVFRLQNVPEMGLPTAMRRSVPGPDGNSLSFVTFFFDYTSPGVNRRVGTVTVNIDERTVQESFREIARPGVDALVLFGTGGVPLASYAPPGRPTVERDLAALIPDGSRQTLVATRDVDGVPSLVAVQRAPSRDWTLVWVRDLAAVTGPLRPAVEWSLVMIASLTVVGIGFAIIVTQRLHAPIRALYSYSAADSGAARDSRLVIDEYAGILNHIRASQEATEELRDRLADATNASRELWFRIVVEEDPRFLDEQLEFFESTGLSDDVRGARVCIVRVHASQSRGTAATVLNEINTELAPREHASFQLNARDAAVLLFAAVDDGPAAIETRLERVRRAIVERTGHQTTMAIGWRAGGAREVHDSYRSALGELEEGFFSGIDRIMVAGESAPTRRYVAYPEKRSAEIWEAITSTDVSAASEAAAAFADAVSQATYLQVIMMTAALVKDITRRTAELVGGDEQLLSSPALRTLNACETFAQVVAVLERFCSSMVAEIESVHANRANRIADRLEEYIDAHYQDLNLSTDTLAEVVSLSSSYARRVYRQIRGRSLGEYIRSKRLEEARRLLLSSRQRIADIAHHTGFPNESYFATLFRRQHGVSPNQYRSERGPEFESDSD